MNDIEILEELDCGDDIELKQAIENLIKENKELKEDIKNMYDEEAIISIMTDEFDLSRNEAMEILENY